jgi:hypothetical protein
MSSYSGIATFPQRSGLVMPDESRSEQLRRESDELLETAAKLIEHAETHKAQAAELRKQIARRESDTPKQNREKP